MDWTIKTFKAAYSVKGSGRVEIEKKFVEILVVNLLV